MIASGVTSTQCQDSIATLGLCNAAEIDDATGGNVIQGNQIGLTGSGKPLVYTVPEVVDPAVVAALALSGSPDTVGGSGPGDGNVIAGGGLISSAGNVVQGNTLTDGGRLNASNSATEDGLSVDGAVTIGGPSATPGQGDGNTFEIAPSFVDTPSPHGLLILGSGAVVQGNVFKDDGTGAILDGGSHVTIGGTSTFGVGNLIEDNGPPPGSLPALPSALPAGIVVAGSTRVNSHTLIEHNDFERNGGSGAVNVDGGYGITITRNVMRGNSRSISLHSTYYYDGQPYGAPSFPGFHAPNDLLPYPLLWTAARKNGTEITGKWAKPSLSGSGFTLELYAERSCTQDSLTPGQAEAFLGSHPITSALGNIPTSFQAAPAGDDAVSATVTAPDGSTSEFSPCLTLGHTGKIFTHTGVTPTTATVPITSTAGPTADRSATATTAKARANRGRGTLILLCPPLTTRDCAGTVVLRTTARRPLTIINAHFKMKPGLADAIHFTLVAGLFAKLEHARRMTVAATITARDGAKHPHRKTTRTKLTLLFL